MPLFAPRPRPALIAATLRPAYIPPPAFRVSRRLRPRLSVLVPTTPRLPVLAAFLQNDRHFISSYFLFISFLFPFISIALRCRYLNNRMENYWESRCAA